MSYRVECAVSNRAGCQQTECKKQGIKIDKGELRFGVWVEIMGNGSWRWKHWGCITGRQLQNVREYLDPEGTGDYQWDRLDGYDDEGKGGLVSHPDLQEKVRRVVTQGFIDAEDWKGDPEMNKLGESAVFTSETKKKIREAAKAEANEIDEDESVKQSPARATKKPATKKRAKAESDDEDAFQESKPAPKKKRVTKAKAKKEDSEGDEQAEVKTKTAAKKGRKKAVKEEPIDEHNGIDGSPEVEPKPAGKKGRKKAVKEEPVDEENDIGGIDEPKPKTAAKKGRTKAVKDAVADEQNGLDDAPGSTKSKTAPKKGRKKAVEADELGADDAPEAKPKAAAKKGRKKAVKKDEEELNVKNGVDEEVKDEPADASLSAIPSTTVEEDAQMNDVLADAAEAAPEDAEVEKICPKKKGGRAKSLDSAKATTEKPASARAGRRRNVSKN